ncbi:histone-lysine N-methyltransferase SETMAR-like [Ornithodoros turicata]|uniref:histone-lysine N-methyltransferase SETMAR-like n=1 Tax=Ornithodoros turicata TaxID=34597 RepID=UPI0031399C31
MFRSTPSAGKVMATVFWDKAGVVHADFLPSCTTINSAYYCQIPRDAHKTLKQKRPGLITKGVLLEDNARTHTAHLTARTLEELGWESLPHPPYSPDLDPNDFHLFGPLKAFLRGRHFSCDDEIKNAVRSLLLRAGKDFYAPCIPS